MSVRHSRDDQYFEWLCRRIEIPRTNNPARSFRSLVKQFHEKVYIWTVPNDDNREQDGKDLRVLFLNERGEGHDDHFWLERPCSVLEMLVALANRIAVETADTDARWFWVFVSNLGLASYSDGYYRMSFDDIPREVDETIEMLVHRTYGRDGLGGLFPLKYPTRNQRDVELWYQMSSYLLEGG